MASDMEVVGFAKLQGADFEYYMQSYSIILGRSNNQFDVDVDLGGGMNISRKHAVIFYDFARKRFALQVFGKNGCFVDGVLYVPGDPPIHLDSRDLLQIGDQKFYFLLPTRSVFSSGVGPTRNITGLSDDEGEEEMMAPPKKLAKKAMAKSVAVREADNLQLMQLEEKDVISCVANMLSELCSREERMPMSNLHNELAEQYGNIWHHSRVRKYLTSEEWPLSETKGKPWFGLLILLRKYPEHFAVTTRSKGRVKAEFVSLVSLVS